MVGLRSPSTSGRATAEFKMVQLEPERREAGSEDRHLDDARSSAEERGNPLDHLPVGHHLGPAGIERLTDGCVVPATPGQGARDVVERDRLVGWRPSSE